MSSPEIEQARRSVEAVWRIESARLIGGLARLTRDLDVAEELAQQALVVALERWPRTGVPDNPGAWLMATAKNLGRNVLARRSMQARKHEVLASTPGPVPPEPERELDEDVGDDLLRLILVACHPVLGMDARVALTLRLLCGLSVPEIARAFLASEATIAQRIVRAKRSLTEAQVPFEVPRGPELRARLGSVLEVIYLVFNEGYAATRGEDWIRPELCDDAMRLGRVLAELVPEEPEVHGLLALMELQASRLRARVDASGAPILLLDQDRSRWDRLLISRGLAALQRARTLGAPLGPYTVQAAIAACHARATTPQQTEWERIVVLYDVLVQLTGSPVVELNRAVAVCMAQGPEPALRVVEGLESEPALRDHPLRLAVHADLLTRLGREPEAVPLLRRAADLSSNERERVMLLERADALASAGR